MNTLASVRKEYRSLKKVVEKRVDAALFVSGGDVLDAQVNRIFTQGKNNRGQLIGRYSNDPLYISAPQSPVRLPKRGKRGATRFKNGKPHRSTYFDGYGDFKQAIGRGRKVNFVVFGRLRSDYSNSLRKKRKGVWVIGPKLPENQRKLSGLVDKYGRSPWLLSNREKKLFRTSFKRELLAA